MKTAPTPKTEALAWLREFGRCLRNRTYDAARPLFHEEVYSFGTVADEARGLDKLVSRQWHEVWDVTQHLECDYWSARNWEQDSLVVVAAPRSSMGSGE